MNTRAESIPGLSSDTALGYRDPKRYAWLFYPLWLLLPVISIVLARASGSTAWYWFTPAFLFLLMPVLDLILGSYTGNVPEDAVGRFEADRYYQWVAHLSVGLHYLALFTGAWVVGTQPLGWIAYVGVALSCALSSAFGIVTAHELGHKKNGLDRWLSKITLTTGVYGQYMVDHNRGHHRDVATPEDSGAARFGENLWYFMFLRQFPHSTVLRPWQLEKERLARKGKAPWSLENEVLQPTLISLATYAVLVAAFGAIVIPYLLVVAFISYFFLAIIDYIEHYGLVRQKTADGRYERVRPEHSWNTDHIATNLLFMHAQRHSDHHAWPTRPYQVLRSFPNLPTMPTGYPGMYWLAILPPLWRAAMYPRLLALVDHDLNRVNVDPRQREQLFARYSKVPDKSADQTFRGVASYAESERAGVFAAIDTGAVVSHADRECPGCGYAYREIDGDPSQGFAPGTRWEQIPATWCCPDCAVRDKADFQEAGAQGFGSGGTSPMNSKPPSCARTPAGIPSGRRGSGGC